MEWESRWLERHLGQEHGRADVAPEAQRAGLDAQRLERFGADRAGAGRGQQARDPIAGGTAGTPTQTSAPPVSPPPVTSRTAVPSSVAATLDHGAAGGRASDHTLGEVRARRGRRA